MKKIKKILEVSLVVSFLLASGAGNALASFETINEGTGFNSVNTVDVDVTDEFASLNQNAEVIANIGDGVSSSGENRVAYNTLGAGVLTGSIGVGGLFSNYVNQNSLNHVGGWMSDPYAGNITTGADSVNISKINIDEFMEGLNVNNADVGSSINIDAFSGKNKVIGNTGPGSIGTGNITGSLGANTTANSNFLAFLAEDFSGIFESGAENCVTGYDSFNKAIVDVETNVLAENINVADVENDIYGKFNSGYNLVKGNSGPVELLTGNVGGLTTVKNLVNNNKTAVGGGAGASDVIARNEQTGALSENIAKASVLQNIEVENTNVADIDNFVKTIGNSGKNKIFGNNGSALLETGNAENEVVIANGLPGANNQLNSNTTIIDLGGGSTVAAVNGVTGAGSENVAEANLINNVAAVNTNEADINNVVKSVANSGNNLVSGNNSGCSGGCGVCGGCGGVGGVSGVSTGNAEANTMISNSGNVNVTEIDLGGGVDVIASNELTGANSENIAEATVVNNVEVSNENYLDITNNVTTESNSGGNTVYGNTGGGAFVETGSSVLNIGVENTGNVNSAVISE